MSYSCIYLCKVKAVESWICGVLEIAPPKRSASFTELVTPLITETKARRGESLPPPLPPNMEFTQKTPVKKSTSFMKQKSQDLPPPSIPHTSPKQKEDAEITFGGVHAGTFIPFS